MIIEPVYVVAEPSVSESLPVFTIIYNVQVPPDGRLPLKYAMATVPTSPFFSWNLQIRPILLYPIGTLLAAPVRRTPVAHPSFAHVSVSLSANPPVNCTIISHELLIDFEVYCARVDAELYPIPAISPLYTSALSQLHAVYHPERI